MLLENSNSTSRCDRPNLINRNRDMHCLFSVCTGLRSLLYVVALYNDNQAKYRLITFCPAVHHFIYIFWHIVEHLLIWVLFAGLARLGQGKAMKARTDNECVLDSVLIDPQFIFHVFPFKSIAI